MASFLFDSFLQDVTCGSIDMDTDTFYGMLVTSSYTPNRATHNRRDDVTNEVVGTGYTAGGAASVITTTLDTTNHKVTFNPADILWSASTITARALVLYKRRGGASSADELVAYVDFGADKVSSAGDFTFHATAPLTLQG